MHWCRTIRFMKWRTSNTPSAAVRAGSPAAARWAGTGRSTRAAPCPDCAVVFEGLGRGPLPGPCFSSGVLAAEIILAGGSPAQKQKLLPEICAGRAIVIPAISDDPISWGPRSVQTRLGKATAGFTLTGTKRFVFDAEAARP